MSDNTNMTKARNNKNNEFYTQYADIEKELSNYKNYFKNKIVYCNCDTIQSNFFKYFINNFNELQLKKLIITSIHTDIQTFTENGIDLKEIKMNNFADFASAECISILNNCDIVVSNPPFSLALLYLETLITSGKQFLFIGNVNAITYKEFFKNIKENKLWLGYTSPKKFITPDGDDTNQVFGLCRWFTNINTNKHNKKLILTKKYYDCELLYPKFDNYDAINIDKTKDIPVDYFGYMGVPITFLDKYNPEQFEILGCTYNAFRPECWDKSVNMFASIDGRNIYKRLIIKRKDV